MFDLDTMFKYQGDKVLVRFKAPDGAIVKESVLTIVHFIDGDERKLQMVDKSRPDRKPIYTLTPELIARFVPANPEDKVTWRFVAKAPAA